jgi:hypothetical protein
MIIVFPLRGEPYQYRLPVVNMGVPTKYSIWIKVGAKAWEVRDEYFEGRLEKI